MSLRKFLSLTLPVCLSACTFVALKPEAGNVAIVNQQAVENCRALGIISVKTQASVGFIERGSEKLQAELATLARNQAVNMQADHLVPDSLISEEGEQDFRAFSCAQY